MQYVCESSKGRIWFRIETDAGGRSRDAADAPCRGNHFRRERKRARNPTRPAPGLERDIMLKAHLARTTPLFLTLRADDGSGLATAMLRPGQARGLISRSSLSAPKPPTPIPITRYRQSRCFAPTQLLPRYDYQIAHALGYLWASVAGAINCAQPSWMS